MSAINGIDIINFIETNFKIKLPEKGLLAGQSVCSIYLYLAKLKNDVHINDIDIFHNVNHLFFYEINILKKNKKNIKELVYLQKLKFKFYVKEEEDYSELNVGSKIILKSHIQHVSYFKYIHSDRDGYINNVYYKGNIKSCMEHFDINCTKIGVDLKTKKLIKLKDFLDFEKKLEIKIINFNTPFHSLIRYSSKIEQFQYNSSKEENFLLANTTINNISRNSEIYCFGNKYKEKINLDIERNYNIKNILKDKLFNLSPKSEDIFDIENIASYFSNNQKLKYTKSDLNDYIINNLRNLYEIYRKDNKKIHFLLNNTINKQKLVYEYLGNNFEKNKIVAIEKIVAEDYKFYNLCLNNKINKKQEIYSMNEYIQHLNLEYNIAEEYLEIIEFYEKKYKLNLLDFIKKLKIKTVNEFIDSLDSYIKGEEKFLLKGNKKISKINISKIEANCVFCYEKGINDIYDSKYNIIYEINNEYFRLNEIESYIKSIDTNLNLKVFMKKFKRNFDYL